MEVETRSEQKGGTEDVKVGKKKQIMRQTERKEERGGRKTEVLLFLTPSPAPCW